MECSPTPELEMTEESSDQVFKCQHYKRKCRFVTPCCNRVYRCRFCHDEEQDHPLRREDVNIVECSACGTRQGVNEFCVNCNIKFGMYFCYECKLYDDEDKQQFHCKGCGICRVGGRSNYFHCNRCDMCLPNHLEGAHKCVEKVSRGNCPVCQEDIHTSRIPSQIPPCNHLIHKNCFDEMLNNGHYACPVCGVSMIPMKEIWKIYDKDIEDTPMPEEYRNLYAKIKCRDCLQTSLPSFHILGMKCTDCGSYNTVREKGPLMRIQNGGTPSAVSHQESQVSASDASQEPGSSGSGTLTPPETPNRDQGSESALGLQPSADGSVRLGWPLPHLQPYSGPANLGLVSPPTPEPSPIREIPQQEGGTTLLTSAMRSITFQEETDPDHDYSWGVETGRMED